MQKISATLLVFMLTAPSGIFAQELTSKRCDGCALNQIFTGAQPTGTLQAAAFREVRRIGANLVAGPTMQQGQQPPQRSWAKRHPALLGALIGLGTGFGVAFLAAEDCGGSGDAGYCAGYLALYSGIGVGVGSAVGFAIGR